MSTVKLVFTHLVNGFRVFGQAARGSYRSSSPEINSLRDEMLEPSSPDDDPLNLRRDLRHIYGDVHVAWQKVM